jgi:membrane-bound serine protease (ClpP class)
MKRNLANGSTSALKSAETTKRQQYGNGGRNFSRAYSIHGSFLLFPALKRWAIGNCPSGAHFLFWSATGSCLLGGRPFEADPLLFPCLRLRRWAMRWRRFAARLPMANLTRRPRWGAISGAFLTGLVASLLLVASTAASAEVLKISVNGTIQPITDEYIGRALAEAQKNHDKALLIELSTPGGLADSTRDIINKILESPVPVIIYVTPSGSRAASAGFFILEAADVAAMAPGTNTGAAHPVTIGGAKMDEVMKEKLENDSAALMRSVAGKRGRNVEMAESAVRQSKSFTEEEALKNRLIDVVAANAQELFKQLSSKPVKRFNGQEVTLNLAGEPVRSYDMTLKQRILAYIMDPNVAFILLAIGALALYAEFNHPGAVLPGTVGIVFILLAAFALNLLPVRHAALLMILGAFVLFALEAKFATHGVLGIGGVAMLTLGALLLVDGPIPEMRVRLTTALAVSLPMGLITVFLMSIALKARRNKIVTGEQGMVGETGVAQTALSPRGKVFVHGEVWDAISSTPVAAGEAVVIRRVDGLQLLVDPVSASADNRISAPVS